MLWNSIESDGDTRRRHQLLAILRVMQRNPDRRANDLFLADCLRTRALGGTQDQVRDALNRLEGFGLITVQPVERLLVAELTTRGDDVAIGRDTCEGVLRVATDCPY